MKCRKPCFQPVEASNSLLISRERCQYPPPEDSAPVYRRGRETTVTRPAGRLGQVNCFKGLHRHRQTFSCCIVPLNEHCLITHAVNDILVVPWLLRAGLPSGTICTGSSTGSDHTAGETPDANPGSGFLTTIPQLLHVDYSLLGLGALRLLLSLSGSALLMGRRLFPI